MVSGEKRNCEGENVLEKVFAVLLDIEGTTTSISFVKDTLFPYVRENLSTYIESHWDDEEFKADLKALKQQAKQDEEDNLENFCPIEDGENEKQSLIKNVLWQMDLDRKTTALKQLQGHIWREGYKNGKLKGHIYNDVSLALKKWSDDGKKLYVYSSGSVEAQKLLFKNSENGNLEDFFTGFFDTKIGPKTEASSYTNIAQVVGCDINQILFLTDVVKEAVAADKAGMQVILVIRDGNTPLTDDEKKVFPTITSFKDLAFETSNKKKKLNEDENETEKDDNVKKSEEINNESVEKMEVDVSEEKPVIVSNPEEEQNIEKIKDIHNEEQKTLKNSEDTNDKVVAGSEILNEGESEKVDADIDIDGDRLTSETNSAEEIKSNSKEGIAGNEKELSVNDEVAVETPVLQENVEQNMDGNNELVAEITTDIEQTKESEILEDKLSEEIEVNETNNVDSDEKVNNKHENGNAKEINDDEKDSKEINGSEANGKLENDIPEISPLKKIAPEEQADSTVEVTA